MKHAVVYDYLFMFAKLQTKRYLQHRSLPMSLSH